MEKEKTNVLEFPKNKVVRDVPPEILEKRNEKQLHKFADFVVEEMIEAIISEFDCYALQISEPDIVLIMEAVRSAINRSHNIDHPLQKFVDKNIKALDINKK